MYSGEQICTRLCTPNLSACAKIIRLEEWLSIVFILGKSCLAYYIEY